MSACRVSRDVSLFVPRVIVMGLSVLGLKVKQGTFRKVVSSCNPPESVRTNLALIGEADAFEIADRFAQFEIRVLMRFRQKTALL